MRRDPCWFRDKRIETIGIHEINEIISRHMWVSIKNIDVEVTKKETHNLFSKPILARTCLVSSLNISVWTLGGLYKQPKMTFFSLFGWTISTKPHGFKDTIYRFKVTPFLVFISITKKYANTTSWSKRSGFRNKMVTRDTIQIIRSGVSPGFREAMYLGWRGIPLGQQSVF